jgi:hypothetical protein
MDLPDAHSSRGDLVKILLVDDQRLLREGLRTLLEFYSDLWVMGEAGDGIQAAGLMWQCWSSPPMMMTSWSSSQLKLGRLVIF